MDYIENGKNKFDKPTKESIERARNVVRALQKQAECIKKQLAREAFDDLWDFTLAGFFFRLFSKRIKKIDDSRRSDVILLTIQDDSGTI